MHPWGTLLPRHWLQRWVTAFVWKKKINWGGINVVELNGCCADGLNYTSSLLMNGNIQRIYTFSLDLWCCLEIVEWANPVCCFQWMVAGPRGQCGLTARWHVVGAHRFEPTPASTPLHVTMGLTAAGQREKHRTVTLLPVWVCSQMSQFYSFIHS